MKERGIYMAKKGWGKLMALAAVSGAVAAGISYVLQYKTYHKELEKDFREFEEDEDGEDKASETGREHPADQEKFNRNYISLTSSKDEFKVAARDMAQATRNVLRDAGSLFSDTAHEAMSAAVDTAHIALNSMKTKKDEWREEHEAEPGSPQDDLPEDEGYLDDDYVDDDDLYDYERLDSEPSYSEKDVHAEQPDVSVVEETADDADDVISVEVAEDADDMEPSADTPDGFKDDPVL